METALDEFYCAVLVQHEQAWKHLVWHIPFHGHAVGVQQKWHGETPLLQKRCRLRCVGVLWYGSGSVRDVHKKDADLPLLILLPQILQMGQLFHTRLAPSGEKAHQHHVTDWLRCRAGKPFTGPSGQQFIFSVKGTEGKLGCLITDLQPDDFRLCRFFVLLSNNVNRRYHQHDSDNCFS